MSTLHFQKNNFAPDIAPALRFAEKWGIQDDSERETVIENATTSELKQIGSCLDSIDDGILTAWLTGPESTRKPLSPEYLAITCLLMAVHSAKVQLRKRGTT